jgi:hypothetical protein
MQDLALACQNWCSLTAAGKIGEAHEDMKKHNEHIVKILSQNASAVRPTIPYLGAGAGMTAGSVGFAVFGWFMDGQHLSLASPPLASRLSHAMPDACCATLYAGGRAAPGPESV